MLSEREKRTLKETRLRNLKRRFTKLMRHSELTDECLELQKEISALEDELNL